MTDSLEEQRDIARAMQAQGDMLLAKVRAAPPNTDAFMIEKALTQVREWWKAAASIWAGVTPYELPRKQSIEHVVQEPSRSLFPIISTMEIDALVETLRRVEGGEDPAALLEHDEAE